MIFWKFIKMHSCTQILHQDVHFSQIYRGIKTRKIHSTDKTLWWKKINLILVYNIYPLVNLSHSIQNFLCFLHSSPLPSRRDLLFSESLFSLLSNPSSSILLLVHAARIDAFEDCELKQLSLSPLSLVSSEYTSANFWSNSRIFLLRSLIVWVCSDISACWLCSFCSCSSTVLPWICNFLSNSTTFLRCSTLRTLVSVSSFLCCCKFAWSPLTWFVSLDSSCLTEFPLNAPASFIVTTFTDGPILKIKTNYFMYLLSTTGVSYKIRFLSLELKKNPS